MYAIILVVCLVSLEGKCISYTEAPPRYYETLAQCQNQMVVSASVLLKALEENKEQGQMTGTCVYIAGVKPA